MNVRRQNHAHLQGVVSRKAVEVWSCVQCSLMYAANKSFEQAEKIDIERLAESGCTSWDCHQLQLLSNWYTGEYIGMIVEFGPAIQQKNHQWERRSCHNALANERWHLTLTHDVTCAGHVVKIRR